MNCDGIVTCGDVLIWLVKCALFFALVLIVALVITRVGSRYFRR